MASSVCLMFFVSGAAGLLFETLWFRVAGVALGNGLWASNIVLASFMAGLAVGNGIAARQSRLLRHPFRLYAITEAIVGVVGVAVVFLLPASSPTLGRLFSHLCRAGLAGEPSARIGGIFSDAGAGDGDGPHVAAARQGPDPLRRQLRTRAGPPLRLEHAGRHGRRARGRALADRTARAQGHGGGGRRAQSRRGGGRADVGQAPERACDGGSAVRNPHGAQGPRGWRLWRPRFSPARRCWRWRSSGSAFCSSSCTGPASSSRRCWR